MRAKSLILLVVALGCGMIAAVAVSNAVMDKGPIEVVEDSVEIFVAVKDLPHAQKISPEFVKLEKWPRSRLPEGALVRLDQIEDKFTNQMIFAGEPILERKLADSRESFSTAIPPGYRVFDIPGSAGYIKPGDHVDILGTFQVGRNAVAESRTVMRNVQVFGINGVTTRDSEAANAAARGSVFQLLVKESQLETLTLANRLGELRLNLRPFGEDSAETSDTDNGESFLNWINDTERSSTAKEKMTSVASSLLNHIAGSAAESQNQMLIITPAGMKKYQWNKASDIPTEVAAETTSERFSGQPTAMPSTGPNGTTGNVYSGYGGYSPTYPTSTTPQQPADVSESGKGANASVVE